MTQKNSTWIRVALIVSIFFCGLQMSCVNNTVKNVYTIDLQHGFEATRVEVWIDGCLHYKCEATTDSSLGFAKSIPNATVVSYVSVEVSCLDGQTLKKDFYPMPNKGVYIGVNFDPIGKILYFQQKREAFRYY